MNKVKENERGITLVALVITVIVLIILAGVTLSTLVGDDGIITKAQEAKQNMENASREEDELIQNLLNDIKGAEGENGGEIEIPEGTIEFGEVTWSNGQAEIEIIAKPGEGESLQYQINGTNEESWQNIASGNKVSGLHHNDEVHARLWNGNTASVQKSKKIEDTKAPEVTIQVGKVTDSSIEVTVNAVENESGLLDLETFEYYIGEAIDGRTTTTEYTYDELNPATEYSLTVKVPDKAGNIGVGNAIATTETIQTIESTLSEGKYVWYTDAYETQQKCIVLYGPENENYNKYGIQILTENNVTNLKLAESSDLEGNKVRYNSLISILNTKAEEYRKKEDNIVEIARSVGSVPDNPNYDASGMFTSNYGYMYNDSGKFKNKDNNYIYDWNQMGILQVLNNNKRYWLASRNVESNSTETYFHVRCVNAIGALDNHYLYVRRGNTVTNLYDNGSTGVRVVFRLKPGIKVISGDGSEENPYTLAP